MEILFLKPEYKNYIWGGTSLKEKFNKKDSNLEKIAESWEVSTNENGKSIIKNGEFSGKTLSEIYDDVKLKEKIFGKKAMELDEFPILIKFIDAEENLSVQVHPDDNYAKQFENSNGKNELWYIIDCEENSKLVCGLKNLDKPLKQIIENDEIEKYLNYIDVKKGDYIYIKAGTIHAIMGGILICEIQQNSNLTYRVFDWNRKFNNKPRELHKEKALQVINLDNKPQIYHSKENTNETILKDEKFNVEKIDINNNYKDESNINTFYAYNVIEGAGTIKTSEKTYDLKIGDSFIIPSNMGKYEIQGNMKLIKTYM